MRMMDRRGMSFRARVFWAIFCVSLLSVWLSLFHARTLLEEKQMGSAREELLRECRMAASLYAARAAGGGDVHALLRLLGHERARVSLVDAAGTVRAESSSRLGERELDNHNDRPEIMEARARGDGYAVRESGSLNEPFAYAAHALTDGSVLRLAVPLAELTDAIDSRLSVLSRLAVAALLLSAVLAVLISGALRRSVDHMVSAVTAIARGNFHRRLRRVPGGEFAPLAEAVKWQTAATLPSRLRDELGLGWGPARLRLSEISESLVRTVLPLVPGALREYPKAHAADRRLEGSESPPPSD